ncbi:hypothetical protein SAMN04489806_0384 [Paramicrobacterium humi]|uniref:DUF4190 domain-containing protein n=1 Tax=Paramicrobacterium humi TaxID=640635 RepID=A0A1H4IYZ3_9MICO|nr:DUF4190 domain-containing protein [Microbacterium humi]SEB39279.1 hypothetical protein SAMN04489806_0384 [Microbacterium humi]
MTEANEPDVPPRPPLPVQPSREQPEGQPQVQQETDAWARPGGDPARAPWNQPAPPAPQQTPQVPDYGQQSYPSPGYPQGQQAPYAQPPQAYPPQPYPEQAHAEHAPVGYGGYPQPQARPRTPKKGLAALVLGIIGVIGGVFFGWTIPLAVIAIILGFIARRNPNDDRTFALWGILTGFAGTVFALGWFTYSIIYVLTR